ncbi:GMC family oxidoreductase [Paraburkholderia susongensis]|uniref:Choline dehydrogenase n=1 Tax=Paraburkholderia susongensis TaxID=1515439 RepID=A0A1X7L561_9BURK|nr:GMC family oxidoreductase N-terminal domain-containing protein [Paraburkholderia susongensis]SMG48991.1 choline dehydrogenase [Paraburkholderia susongensis]
MSNANENEMIQSLLDQVASGRLGRRRFMAVVGAAGLTAGLGSGLWGAMVDLAFAAGDNQAANQAKLEGAYDYIVVGAGASGAIVAGDLSKTGAKVLVIESGGADTAPTISNPSVWFYNVGGPLDWKLPIAPVPQLDNRKFNMALGHVLGGGSSINAMVWSRGLKRDYDAWERGGAKGWGFKDVLPTYKAQEDWQGGANEWRGAGGPVHIRTPGDPHPTAPAFIEAARQMGFPVIDDVNGPMRAGAGYINMNIAADGTRVSSSRAFLRPNLDRPNLTLALNTNVTKVVFEGDRASGVEIDTADGARNIRATREVILAAGAIHTPKLLMLSGVGDAAQLQKLGIKPVANLRGVGQNLQDHVLVSGVVYQYKGKMPNRPADSNAVDAEVYLSSGVDSHSTDINLVLEQLPIATPEAAARFGAPPKEGFTIAPALVQPTSRGHVLLASADWRDAPIIEGNYLGTDRDLAAIVRAIEVARELGSQHALDSVREAEVVPGSKATSRQDLIELARTAAASFGHAVGTAKIGTGDDAVVDSELRVHGLRGLRVADASVMPSIISGPTNAPAFMIGGRAAEFIKAVQS